MDDRTVKDLCQRLDELGTILELMEGEPVSVALHREASDALNQALSEIESLRAEADLHRETSHALRDALAEIERLQSEVRDLQHTKFAEVLAIFRRRCPPRPLTGSKNS